MKPVHLFGYPLPAFQVAGYFRAKPEISTVWCFLRLAQDPGRVYRGRVLDMAPPDEDFSAWRIVTKLAFHADDRRVSFLADERGVEQGIDECLYLVALPDGAEPDLASVGFDELLASFLEDDVRPLVDDFEARLDYVLFSVGLRVSKRRISPKDQDDRSLRPVHAVEVDGLTVYPWKGKWAIDGATVLRGAPRTIGDPGSPDVPDVVEVGVEPTASKAIDKIVRLLFERHLEGALDAAFQEDPDTGEPFPPPRIGDSAMTLADIVQRAEETRAHFGDNMVASATSSVTGSTRRGHFASVVFVASDEATVERFVEHANAFEVEP